MNRFTHFEFVTGDPEKTAAFYRDVFGWKIQKREGPVPDVGYQANFKDDSGVVVGLHQADPNAGMGN